MPQPHPTQVALGETRQFEACGLARTDWSNAGPIRAIFREAFARAGIPYADAHSFRAILVGLGEKRRKPPEEFKAWSQSMGHEGVLTTFTSYGEVSRERQALFFDRSRLLKKTGMFPPSRSHSKLISQLRGIPRSGMRSRSDTANAIAGGSQDVLHSLMRQLSPVCGRSMKVRMPMMPASISTRGR